MCLTLTRSDKCIEVSLLFLPSECVSYSCAVMINIDLIGTWFEAVCGYHLSDILTLDNLFQPHWAFHPLCHCCGNR